MHLQMAQLMKTAVLNTAHYGENGRLLHDTLTEQWPAFCLGQIAPDFSPIAKLSRYDTHFYPIPLPNEHDTIETLFAAYPSLRQAERLPAAQRVFVAGYIAHLLYDVVWYRQVLIPGFVQDPRFADRAHRRLAQFVMLAWFDQLAFRQLDRAFGVALKTAVPQNWLPFGNDAALCDWAEMIAIQFEPDQPILTLNVYASRVGLAPDQFRRYFEDEAWMNQCVHIVLSDDQFVSMLHTTAAHINTELISYLTPDT